MARKEPVATAEYVYTVLLQPEPEGGYTVTCPAVPGLVSYGDSLEEARQMAAEAIEAYLESLQKDGVPIPDSDVSQAKPVAEQVRVKLQVA